MTLDKLDTISKRMSKQAFLFPELKDEETGETHKAAASAKTLLRELYKIRANNPDNPFMPGINALIEKCRNFINAAPSQVEEKILYAIEKQMCWTLSEIVEETKISREVISEILEELKKQNLVRFVSRYIPGSDRKYFLVKSNRQDVPEMSDL